jgi:hypothetical protein
MVMKAEISFDLAVHEDMPFVEGAFRVPGGAWEVFIVERWQRPPVKRLEVNRTRWDSGVEGFFIRLPETRKLNKAVVLEVLSETLGVRHWNEVRGPDSLRLR